MRKLILFLLLFSFVYPAAMAQERAYPASFTIKLTNDAGEPIAEYPVKISTFSHWKPGTGFGKDFYDYETRETGADGFVSFKYPSKRGRFGINLYPAPDEYYITWPPHYEFDEVVDGRWVPENPTIEVVLKRKKNPISMYARNLIRGLRVPVLDRRCSFDFQVGDWVTPHGRGQAEDIVFHVTLKTEPNGDFRSVVEVSFVREKDGLIRFEREIDIGSKLRSDYEAPNLGYVDRVTLIRTKVGHKFTNSASRNANYYFRVRTELDEEGNIISANYGKIYGDFMYFTYYFNPTPNDRNIEFDPNPDVSQTREAMRGKAERDPRRERARARDQAGRSDNTASRACRFEVSAEQPPKYALYSAETHNPFSSKFL